MPTLARRHEWPPFLVAIIIDNDCRLRTDSPREIRGASASHSQVIISRGKLLTDLLVAHTGLEPVISALRGQRVNQLHQCAALNSGIIDVIGERPQPRVVTRSRLCAKIGKCNCPVLRAPR